MSYNLLQKLLGLDKADKKANELIEKLNQIEYKFSAQKENEVVDVIDKTFSKEDYSFNIPDPLDLNQNLFSFEILQIDNSANKKKVSGDAITFLRNLGSSIPELASNGLLANSYRFVFPEGISGTIMKLPLGQGTALTKAGKIVGHGAYVSNLAVAAPLIVFTIGSMIIRQHYLSKINENLNEIKATVSKLFELEFIKKHAQIESIISFLSKAQTEFEYIENNKEYKNAYLVNIIRVNTEIVELIMFYRKSIILIETDDTEQMRLNMKYYLALHNIFILGKLLEFKYAAEYNHFLLENLKASFEDLSYQSINLLKKNQMDAYHNILKIEDSKSLHDVLIFQKSKKQNKIENLTSSKDIIVETMQRQRENLQTVQKEITDFQQQLKQKKTFLIEDGELYEVIE